MDNLKGIALAVEHAKRKRDALIKMHTQALQKLASAEQQLLQLQSYAMDIDAKWTGAMGLAYTSEVMRHHHQFAGRLQQAIGMQSEVIADMSQSLADAHAAMLQAEFRVAAIQKLYESRQQQALRLRERREQSHSDELATMQFLRNRKMNNLGVPHDT